MKHLPFEDFTVIKLTEGETIQNELERNHTKVFLKQKNIAISEVNLKQYMSDCGKTLEPQEIGGLRLTDTGYDFVRNELDLATYDVFSKTLN